MSIQHVSRTGKTYYLHGKPGKSAKPNYFFSTDADDPLVDIAPDGYEIYENARGLVFLRRIPKKLITDAELALVRAALIAHAEEWIYRIEIKKTAVIIYGTEEEQLDRSLNTYGFLVSPAKAAQLKIQFAIYQELLRFTLADPEKRLFAPERFCYRGSVEDWIWIGPPEKLATLLKKYVKHLGQESFYDLF